jgi:nicotinamidase-related amidase
MPIDPKTTALLLIEYQNDFTTEGRALPDCAATLSEEEQRFTFEKNLPMFARLLTHTEFLSDQVL